MSQKMDLKIEDRDTLHLKVCRVLREAILRGEFKPGQRLVQEELANSLGVSRMPVREALRKLESEGLVSIEPHRGAVVKSLTVEDVKEIYVLRSQFEKMAVEKSVERMGKEDIQALENVMEEMKRAEDAEEFIEKNIQFHRLLVKRCPWNRLLSFIETLWNGFPQQTPHLISGQIEKSNEEHTQILEAVKAGRAAEAAELVSEHIKRTGDALVERLQSGE
ncbi:MAG: GntR family transcriptional regulator [Bacillaceae bacterium]|nr:GntR family transcriptional regulator [Bacillaceae bacterium]